MATYKVTADCVPLKLLDSDHGGGKGAPVFPLRKGEVFQIAGLDPIGHRDVIAIRYKGLTWRAPFSLVENCVESGMGAAVKRAARRLSRKGKGAQS